MIHARSVNPLLLLNLTFVGTYLYLILLIRIKYRITNFVKEFEKDSWIF